MFLLALTFVTGVFIGAYIYVSAFKPVYAPEGLSKDEMSASDFSVIGQAYGGFHTKDYIQPSFRLLADGSYSFVEGGTGANSLDVVEGKLSGSLLNEVRDVIYQGSLESLSQPVNNKSCVSAADGIDYEYKVSLDGESYKLDTCLTNLDYNDELAEVFYKIWLYMESPTNTLWGSPADMLEEYLRRQFER